MSLPRRHLRFLPEPSPWVAAVLVVLAGCQSNSGGKGQANLPDLGCQVPGECDEFSAGHEDALHQKLLRLYDQLEMASGRGNEGRVIPVVQELELMLNNCPRLVLPRLIEQMNRPVHELQRANLAMVLGWYMPGKECSAPHLRALLQDPVPLVRYHAAAALCDLKDESGLPLLVEEGLASKNTTVVQRTVDTLSDFAGRPLENVAAARAWYSSR